MTHDEVLKLFYAISAEWEKFEISDDRAALWQMALGHMTLDQAMAALALYLRNGSPFPPRPSDLLDQVASEATVEIVPDAAWEEVLREVSRVGLNPMPYWEAGVHHPAPVRTFSHPLIEQAVESVGWREICTSTKLGVQQAYFRDALEALTDRYKRDIRNHGVEPATAMLEARSRRVALGGMVAIGDVIGGPDNERHSEGDGDSRAGADNPEGHAVRGDNMADRPRSGLERLGDRGSAGYVRIQRQRRGNGPSGAEGVN